MMDDIFHNKHRLKPSCKILVEAPNKRHKSISENHLHLREFAWRDDSRFCSECCAVVIIEDYE